MFIVASITVCSLNHPITEFFCGVLFFAKCCGISQTNKNTVSEKCDKHFQYSYYHYEITQYKIKKAILNELPFF